MVQHKTVLKSMDSGARLPHLQSLLHHLATSSVTLRKLPHPSLAQFHHLLNGADDKSTYLQGVKRIKLKFVKHINQ